MRPRLHAARTLYRFALAVCAVTGVGVSGCQGRIGGRAGTPTGVAGGDAAGRGGGGGTGQVSDCSSATLTRRVWRLSDEQYGAAVKDLLGSAVTVPAVVTPGRQPGEFINLAERYPADGAFTASVRDSATAVATAAVKDLNGLLKCSAGQDQPTCVGAFIDRFVPRAYRRPIDDDDRQALMTVYDVGAKTSPSDGVRLVLQAVLQSPSFLYRTELGSPGATGISVTLTPYEVASTLSFLLTNSIPDDELWGTAQDGSIATREVFGKQLTRLLGTPRAQDNISKMYLKWLGLGAGITTELDKATYPEYTDALRQSMYQESSMFLSGLLSKGGTFTDLLTSRSTFVDKNLATLYGVPYTGGANGGFVPATLPDSQRAGILTQAGLVVSKSRGHAVVIRGHFVLRDIFCQDVPSPPPTINTAMFSNMGLTERGESQARQDTQPCGACHKPMDQFGLVFLKYDALARVRTAFPDGSPIDSSSSIHGTDVDGAMSSPIDLANAISRSAQAKTCMSQSLLAYAEGVDPSSTAPCEVAALASAVDKAGGHLSDVVSAIAQSKLFALRAGGQ